ncbi:MAG TPA: pantoate--beta-alanine ligase [Rhodanobacteraceae bacterium]|nr:pantoate--beta-alanine ligase [Rhodanobacteraceae bacterium]
MMQTVTDASALRAVVRSWRGQGESIGFVPTMGNLHAGHHALVQLARARCARVVVSVFVNPTQFGPGEDFARYPRTLTADQAGLDAHGCDLLFAPEPAVLYPFGTAQATRVQVPGLTEVLEGAHRPGHFDGVTSVVARLFNLVQADVAVFGRKDYQQWRVIERMTRDLALPVAILGAPIVREADGLALSSRNQYLSAEERRVAPEIHATLAMMRDFHAAGEARAAIEQRALSRLQQAGFLPDYAAIRRGEDLGMPAADERSGLVALIAARLGRTRLIDNLVLD